MTIWDVFHSDRLEVERGLNTAAVRSALEQGLITEDDLVRPTASGLPWERIGDRTDLLEPEPNSEPEPVSSDTEAADLFFAQDDDDEDELEILSDPEIDANSSKDDDSDDELEILDEVKEGPNWSGQSHLDAMPSRLVPSPEPFAWEEPIMDVEIDDDDLHEDAFIDDDEEEYDPLEEDEAVAEFTLARSSAETVEELDLAAMVDVAFQLVLFFLVTATTVLYKSLEVPKPNADAPPDAATQGRSKTLDELKADFILVEMDAAGSVKVDRQPLPGNVTMMSLAEKLRTLRTDTGRTAMLFSAEYATPHAKAVLAYDAANEIGLAIKIAKPTGGAAASIAPPAVIKKS